MRGTALVLTSFIALTACQRTQRDIQLDHAARMTPRNYKSVASTTTRTDEITTLTVRVWVDPAYRTDTVRWRERIEDQFDRTTAMAEQTAGLRLQVMSIATWTPTGHDLPDLLRELALHDEGEGVDLVVAMTGSFGAVTQSQHNLGRANILGKHIVVRAMNDAAEWSQFERDFDRLKADERRAVYRERLRHKEASVLLHEVGHTLGALHTRGDGVLMSPTYSVDATQFCPENREILAGTLAIDRSKSHTAWRREATDVVERAAEADGGSVLDPAAVQSLRANADRLGPAEVKLLERISTLATAGRYDEALVLIEGLNEKLPGHPAFITQHCGLALQVKPDEPRTHALCARAHELNPANYHSLTARAISLRHQERWDEAGELAIRVHDVLNEAEQPGADQWLFLARIYVSLSMPSLAEEAIAGTQMLRGASEVRDDITFQRRFFCVPAGSVDPKDEGAAIRGVGSAWTRLQDGDPAALDGLAAQFPGLPGAEALQCQLKRSKGNDDEAVAACRRALDAGPCYPAHYVMGSYHLSRGELEEARTQLESAAAIHDEDASLAEMLRRVDQRQGDGTSETGPSALPSSQTDGVR